MFSVYVDFQNSDRLGRARLNTVGSLKDLSRQGVVLTDGLAGRLYCEEFEAPGIVEYSTEEGIWTASYNWEERKELSTPSRAPERQTARSCR